jgi:hypothetical protein
MRLTPQVREIICQTNKETFGEAAGVEEGLTKVEMRCA